MKFFTYLCLILSASAALAEDRFAAVEMKAQHIAGSVHMIQGAGGNIGASVGVDGTLIVDDQFAPLADKIVAALGELGGDRPKLILNTHYHGDHTGSNPEFGRTGTILAHDNVRVRLLDAADFSRSGLPVVTYDDDLSVHFNDEEITVMHMPSGHTDGDSIVWFKTANVIHLGDHYFNGRFPYVDIDAGGDVDGFIKNLAAVVAMVPADITIIPGHGSLSDIPELNRNIEVLRTTRQAISDALKLEQSVAEVTAAIESEYPQWGSGFISAERWVLTIQKNDAR